jgi:3-methyladenine DNA glycosylase AlkD
MGDECYFFISRDFKYATIKSMNTSHKNLLQQLAAVSMQKRSSGHGKAYHGTPHVFYNVNTTAKREIAKTFQKQHPHLSYEDLIDILNALYAGESYEEKTLASLLCARYPKHRARITPSYLRVWLEHLEGWAEIDALCQPLFSARDMFSRWNEWRTALKAFSTSPRISKKRASLVLLTKPVRELKDERLKTIALGNIEKLKTEKDILITKAISWLLREMIKNYRKDVKEYLKQNHSTLPTIVVRETERKLKTGKK